MADENKSIREQIKKDNEFNLKLAQQEASVQRDLAKILSDKAAGGKKQKETQEAILKTLSGGHRK